MNILRPLLWLKQFWTWSKPETEINSGFSALKIYLVMLLIFTKNLTRHFQWSWFYFSRWRKYTARNQSFWIDSHSEALFILRILRIKFLFSFQFLLFFSLLQAWYLSKILKDVDFSNSKWYAFESFFILSSSPKCYCYKNFRKMKHKTFRYWRGGKLDERKMWKFFFPSFLTFQFHPFINYIFFLELGQCWKAGNKEWMRILYFDQKKIEISTKGNLIDAINYFYGKACPFTVVIFNRAMNFN